MFVPDGVPPDAVAAMEEDLKHPARPPAPDYEVLFPERDLVISGEAITVREYTFAEGLRIGYTHRDLLVGLADLFTADGVDVGSLQGVLGEHWSSVLSLMALASGRDADWIGALSDSDGQALLLTWWAVNQDFFGRRLMAAVISRNQGQIAESGAPSPP